MVLVSQIFACFFQGWSLSPIVSTSWSTQMHLYFLMRQQEQCLVQPIAWADSWTLLEQQAHAISAFCVEAIQQVLPRLHVSEYSIYER